MSSRGREFTKGNQNRNDMLPTSSGTQLQSGVGILADELSKATDAIRWRRVPEMSDLERLADENLIAGFSF